MHIRSSILYATIRIVHNTNTGLQTNFTNIVLNCIRILKNSKASLCNVVVLLLTKVYGIFALEIEFISSVCNCVYYLRLQKHIYTVKVILDY